MNTDAIARETETLPEPVSLSVREGQPLGAENAILAGGTNSREESAQWRRRGLQSYRAGALVQAAEEFREGLKIAESAILWNDYGTCLVALCEFAEAERAYKRALQLDPGCQLVTANLAALYMSWLGLERPLVVEHVRAKRNAAGVAAYEEWFESVFGTNVAAPSVRVCASWRDQTYWGKRAQSALAGVECEYVMELLKYLKNKNVPGDIVEFGIFEGWWVNYLWKATEETGLRRRIYGFDSFEGLSEPHPEFDDSFWKKGQYACSLEQVMKNVSAAARPRIRLVKGFFEQSLRCPEALAVDQFCYARIDCDIYQPALDCLRYLGHRLADGAILVFDDWPHARGVGEQRAFEQWLPSVPHLEFEFLFYGCNGHFYLRVHHRK